MIVFFSDARSMATRYQNNVPNNHQKIDADIAEMQHIKNEIGSLKLKNIINIQSGKRARQSKMKQARLSARFRELALKIMKRAHALEVPIHFVYNTGNKNNWYTNFRQANIRRYGPPYENLRYILDADTMERFLELALRVREREEIQRKHDSLIRQFIQRFFRTQKNRSRTKSF